MYLKTRVHYERKLRAAPPVATAVGNGHSGWKQPITLLAALVPDAYNIQYLLLPE